MSSDQSKWAKMSSKDPKYIQNDLYELKMGVNELK